MAIKKGSKTRTNYFLNKTPDQRGKLAEKIADWLLSWSGYTFEVVALHSKYETVDLYVELSTGSKYFFFVQVKSTIKPRIGKDKKLQVKVSKTDVIKLARYRAPTYIIGVDFADYKNPPNTYISTVRGKDKKGVTVIPTTNKYKVTPKNVQKLTDEVIAYWKKFTDDEKDVYTSNFDR